MSQNSEAQNISLTPWDPLRILRRIDASEARYSRGFLRSRPERWFPGFATQWLPLAHALGIELRVADVKPTISMPGNLTAGFCGLVDDEPIAIYLDETSLDYVLDAIAPGVSRDASKVIAEYMARRLLGSLALTWSGPEGSVVRFSAGADPSEVTSAAAVKFSFDISGSNATVWLSLGRALVEKLDGLWRRQVRSASRSTEEGSEVRVELVHLGVPPAVLVDYVKAGAIVDLETAQTDHVILRAGNKGWLPARLVNIGGNFGFEIITGAVPAHTLPQGTTRLAVEFGTVYFDNGTLAEMAQVGAIWDTGIKLSNKVSLSINNEKVGSAALSLFEGRFAITVE